MRAAALLLAMVCAEFAAAAGGLGPAFFGVEPVNVSPAVGESLFDLAAELGVGRVGVNALDWEDLEPSPGVYDWSLVDALARAADARGLELEVTFQVRSSWGTETVGGSVGAPGSSPPRPEYRDELLRTVRALVRRLDGPPGERLAGLSGPVLAQLMIGNEIEVPEHWTANGSAANPATPAS